MNIFARKKLVNQIAIMLSAAHCLGTGIALAQVTPAAPPVAKSAALEEIVVTAQRRSENLQEVPVSVTAVTAEQLADRNITDVSQMEGMSPGFTFGRSGTDARPAMRGVRTENVAVNGDTTIGYFVDGVYKSRAQQALAGFVDIARVEIQRGPQGTLYGRNTFGGNISVITNEPIFKQFQSAASVLVGDYSRARVEGVLNIPASDTIAVRLVGAYEKSDGYVENSFNSSADLFGQDLAYGRIAIRFQPNSRFDATLRADITDGGGNGGSAFGYKQGGTYLDRSSCQQLFNASLLVLNVRGGNRDAVSDCTRTVGAGAGTGANAIGANVDLGIPIHAAGNAYRIDNNYQTYQALSDSSGSLDMAYKFDAFTLKSITGYADFKVERTADSDMSASQVFIDYQLTKARTVSQELQILSAGKGPLSYVAGYYYFKDNLRGTLNSVQQPRIIRSEALTSPLVLPQNGGAFFDDPIADTESNAIYAQFAWKATDQLTLTLGGRYTEDKKNFRFANTNSIAPLNAAGVRDSTLITFDTPGPPDSAYGTAGTSNCVPARGTGFHCDPANPAVLLGATYDQKTFSKTTARAAIDYKIDKDHLLFASYSTGFRSGGFNSGQAVEAVRTFLPEEVEAFEVGSKNRLLDNTLQINLAAFSNQYTNLQEQRQVPVGLATISTIFNAAKARANGVEMELEWRASDRMSLGGTLSLLDAKYTSFPDVALPFGTSILVTDPSSTAPTVVNGVIIAPAGQRRVFAPGYTCGVISGTGGAGQPAAAFGCDLSGKRVPYAARSQGSIYSSYEIDLANGGRLIPLAVVTYNSGYYGQPTNAEIEKQGSYTKLDLKLNWEVSRDWSALFFVDNVTDKQVINRFVWGGGGAMQVSAAPPRTWGVRVTYKTF